MITINWSEFKEFKKHRNGSGDNFVALLDFVKSYYNMTNPIDIFDTLINDGLSQMMLEKRGIVDAEGLENYLFKPVQ